MKHSASVTENNGCNPDVTEDIIIQFFIFGNDKTFSKIVLVLALILYYNNLVFTKNKFDSL